MQNNTNFRATVVSDFNNFKNNLYSLFSLLPVKMPVISIPDSLYELDSIIKNKKTDLIILNNAGYTQEDIDYLFKLEHSNIPIIIIIDQYFSYKPLFMNFEKGIITIRRPVSINKLLEILKISLYGITKKKKESISNKEILALEMAKTFLVIYENMYEDESHKFIGNSAMNERTTIYDESLKIVKKYLLEKENIIYECKN